MTSLELLKFYKNISKKKQTKQNLTRDNFPLENLSTADWKKGSISGTSFYQRLHFERIVQIVIISQKKNSPCLLVILVNK